MIFRKKTQKMKRIYFYRLPLILLFFYFSFVSLYGQKPVLPDTLTIVHLTDIHTCNLTGYHPTIVSQRQYLMKNSDMFSGFIDSAPQRFDADFFVITGDLVDFYEAETATGKIIGTQIEQFADLINDSEIPFFLTLGNHDIATYTVPQTSKFTSEQIRAGEARASWMRNMACFRNGTYYSRIYKVDTLTVRLLFLDNSFIADEDYYDGVQPFIVDQYQLKWLDRQLKASPTDVEIIFTHIPLPSGKKTSSSILSEPLSTYSSKASYYDLLNLLEKHSSTWAVIAGHTHTNSVNEYVFPDGDKLTQIVTGSFGNDRDNWRIIKITGDKIMVSHPGDTDNEIVIQLR